PRRVRVLFVSYPTTTSYDMTASLEFTRVPFRSPPYKAILAFEDILVAPLARVELHQVLDGLQDVLEGQDGLVRGPSLVRPAAGRALVIGEHPPPGLLPVAAVGSVQLAKLPGPGLARLEGHGRRVARASSVIVE